jgi:hypothetical protein
MTHAEQVLIRGKVFLYKQKAPFVPSGKSVRGALEYDEETDKVRCHECGRWFQHLGLHIAGAHPGITLDAYRERHRLKSTAPLCGVRASAVLHERASAVALVRGSRAARVLNSPDVQAKAANSRRERIADRKGKGLPGLEFYEERNENGTCHAQILNDIKTLADRLGRAPTQREMLTFERPMHANSICLAFNVKTIADVFSLVGLVANKPGSHGGWNKKYSKEVLAEMLRDFYVKHGRMPTPIDIKKLKLLPHYTIFCRYFGSMAAAYEAAGLAKVAQEQRAA